MKKYIIFTILYILYINTFQGYFTYLPTIPIYPNNKNEVKLVIKNINNRTYDDIRFFYLTNKSVSYAFKPFVNESIKELDAIATSHNFLILFLKYIINRARPEQVNTFIKPINKSTAMTPAFPAGHSYQAYLLYKVLSKKYPEKQSLFKKIALKCDDCRVKAGLHYPSDGQFSRNIIDIIYK